MALILEPFLVRSIKSKLSFLYVCMLRPLEHWMEEWLRLLLEWDPQKRGRHPGSGDVAVFPLLKDMLTRKVCFTVLPFIFHLNIENGLS